MHRATRRRFFLELFFSPRLFTGPWGLGAPFYYLRGSSMVHTGRLQGRRFWLAQRLQVLYVGYV